jgi:hypothetical protein
MGIQGTSLKSGNGRLRMLIIILIGILGFGAVLIWRTKTYEQAEKSTNSYQSQLNSELRSKNYQIEVQDSSPVVQ